MKTVPINTPEIAPIGIEGLGEVEPPHGALRIAKLSDQRIGSRLQKGEAAGNDKERQQEEVVASGIGGGPRKGKFPCRRATARQPGRICSRAAASASQRERRRRSIRYKMPTAPGRPAGDCSSKDFMNCRISTSFRLLAIPQSRKSPVTRKKAGANEAGKSGLPLSCSVAVGSVAKAIGYSFPGQTQTLPQRPEAIKA